MSSDPSDSDKAEIDPHYFEHAADLDIFMETAKFARNLCATETLKDMIGGSPHIPTFPVTEVLTSDQQKRRTYLAPRSKLTSSFVVGSDTSQKVMYS